MFPFSPIPVLSSQAPSRLLQQHQGGDDDDTTSEGRELVAFNASSHIHDSDGDFSFGMVPSNRARAAAVRRAQQQQQQQPLFRFSDATPVKRAASGRDKSAGTLALAPDHNMDMDMDMDFRHVQVQEAWGVEMRCLPR